MSRSHLQPVHGCLQTDILSLPEIIIILNTCPPLPQEHGIILFA